MSITDTFINTYWAVAEQGVKIIVPIIAIWLIMKLLRSFLLGGK